MNGVTYHVRKESEGWSVLRQSGGHGGRIIGVWTTEQAAEVVRRALELNLPFESR